MAAMPTFSLLATDAAHQTISMVDTSSPLSLFATAASPVLQAGLIAAAGAGMAWQGALDAKGRSVVAALCFYVFTPALTFSTLAAAISINSIKHLWPLLANMTLSSLLGLAIGHFTATILRTPKEFRKLVIVACAFGNVGNLPLVFVGALCGDTRAIFQKTLGKECEPLGIAYTAFDICVATLFQFTLALYLLKPKPSGGHGHNGHASSDTDYQVVVQQDDVSDERQHEENEQQQQQQQQGPEHRGPSLHKDPTLSDLLHATSSTPSPNYNNNNIHRGRGGQFEIELDASTASSNDGRLLYSKIKNWCASIDWKAVFPIPTQAAFGGVIVGCIPFLKNLFYGMNPPLQPIAEALELLGQGLIPGAIPLLGAVLYKGPGKSQLPARVTIGVVLVRLVLQPVLLTSLVLIALEFKLFTSPDPMFLLTLLLANATPTAINMQTLTVLYKFGAEEMSQMLFFQYLCSLVTLPVFVWLFLKIIHAYVEDVGEGQQVLPPP